MVLKDESSVKYCQHWCRVGEALDETEGARSSVSDSADCKDADMRKVRRNGSHGVIDERVGNVYEHANGNVLRP